MMGCRGNRIGALGNHPGFRHLLANLMAWQMAADSRLRPLAHLNFDGRPGHEVILMDPEASGSHLDDGIGTVLVELLIEAALPGIVAGTQLRSRPGQGFVGILTDGAIGHGREHNGQLQFNLGGQV